MYLLDTNILSELIKKKPDQNLMSQLRTKASHELFTLSICVLELRFGSRLRDDFEDFWSHLNREIISRINIIPFGEKEAIIAGDILAKLKKSGKIIGIEDILIAASAMANQFTVATGNIRHFSRVKGLICENWFEVV